MYLSYTLLEKKSRTDSISPRNRAVHCQVSQFDPVESDFRLFWENNVTHFAYSMCCGYYGRLTVKLGDGLLSPPIAVLVKLCSMVGVLHGAGVGA